MPQRDTLDEELTVEEKVWVYGRYFGLSKATVRERTTELLELAQLSERSGSLVEPLSGGMKRRLTIARALVNNAQILLLDEATTGPDLQARHVLWDRLFRRKREGVTLVLATGWLQPLAWATPLWHTVDAPRSLVPGTAPPGLVLGHVACLICWLVIGYVLSVRVLRRRMVL